MEGSKQRPLAFCHRHLDQDGDSWAVHTAHLTLVTAPASPTQDDGPSWAATSSFR